MLPVCSSTCTLDLPISGSLSLSLSSRGCLRELVVSCDVAGAGGAGLFSSSSTLQGETPFVSSPIALQLICFSQFAYFPTQALRILLLHALSLCTVLRLLCLYATLSISVAISHNRHCRP